jgi:hypothetical protein
MTALSLSAEDEDAVDCGMPEVHVLGREAGLHGPAVRARCLNACSSLRCRKYQERAPFLGVLAFAVPLTLLQVSIRADRVSALALAPFTAWVIGYDTPWTYLLWRRNP